MAEPASRPTASLMAMEAANRWETEAIRDSRDRRSARPTVSQGRKAPNPVGDWRTLREVADETGIPIGTLRKWCRRESVDSYLESDGEQTLRMLEMGSVRRNARAVGRVLAGSPDQEATGDRRQAEEGRQQTANSRQPEEGRQAEESRQTPDTSPQPEEGRQATGDRRQAEEGRQPTANSRQPEEGRQTPDRGRQSEPPAAVVRTTDYGLRTTDYEAGTMIVPIDAWNKMLNQLGNLHEAGQQLAEARERAGKAETEAKFLRERLAEMRERSQQLTADSQQPEDGRQEEESQQLTADSQQPGNGRQATGDRRQAGEDQQPDRSPVSSTDASTSSSPSGGGAAAGGGGGQKVPAEDTAESTPVPSAEGRGDAEERSDDAGGQGSLQSPIPGPQPETTSFFRYIVRGWRGRKR